MYSGQIRFASLNSASQLANCTLLRIYSHTTAVIPNSNTRTQTKTS